MQEIGKEQLERLKKQGLDVYLLLHWIIAAAIPASIILTLLRWLSSDRTLSFFATGQIIRQLLIALIFCMVPALIFGLRKWFQYDKLLKTKHSERH